MHEPSEARHLGRDLLDPRGFLFRILCDPTYRREVEFCHTHGIPPSQFRGEPAPGPGDVVWTSDDRAEIHAWSRYAAERCPSCGVHPDEWPRQYIPAESPWDIELDPCHACRALDSVKTRIERQNKRQDVDMSWVGVRPRFVRMPGFPLIPGWHPPPQ